MGHEFELWQDGIPVAMTNAESRDDALREIKHYAAVYGQDGPVEVFEITRAKVDLPGLNAPTT